MEDREEITEVRKKLNALAPLAEHAEVTAAQLARYFGIRAQERFRRGLNGTAFDHAQISAMGAEFAACAALTALAKWAPAKEADETASEIWGPHQPEPERRILGDFADDTTHAYEGEWILKFPSGFQVFGDLTFADDWEPCVPQDGPTAELEATGSAGEGDDAPRHIQGRANALSDPVAALNEIAGAIRGRMPDYANLLTAMSRLIGRDLAGGDPR
ncbi:MAG: hypothetical protein M3Y33_06210 [Actinomycetota bacterium]|nr:hypothetical protein [Actinomycetota bacterium]